MANKASVSYIHPIYKRIDLWLFLACIIVFVSFPKIDLIISAHYFNGEFFIYNENPYVQFVSWLFDRIYVFYLLLFVYLGLRSFYLDKHDQKKKFFFLVISLGLIYLLFINVLLENYFLGRAHPTQLKVFGGLMDYAGPFQYSGECNKNCSFVSDHTAAAFFLLAIAWVRNHPIWIVYGGILGVTVGFIRIIQGENFLSDVIFAGWLTWFVCLLIAMKMQLPLKIKTTIEN